MNPQFDNEIYSQLTVVILGVGTLGSNFIYNLISYGFLNFVLVDYGQLSYSNLSRQTLYNLSNFEQDSQANYKVDAAKM